MRRQRLHATPLQKPIGPNAALCTDADISAFITACGITSGTQAACSAWQTATATTCVGCLLTQQTATSWGLAVCTTTLCAYNSAGCIDLTLSQTSQEKSAGGSGSCGDLVQASFGCEDYACNTCSTTDFKTCVTSAVGSECLSYATAQQSATGPCSAIDGSASESSCFPQTDNDISAMATLFCGGLIATPDAGTDAGGTPDAGGKDAGTSKDAGKDSGSSGDAGDAGGDGGTDANFGKSGCHCDAAGATGTGDALMIVALGAFVAIAASRRRRTSR